MENASDALIMAGQVLIFIVALTVCMSSFSTLRQHINDITEQKETIQMAKGSEGYINYIESKENKATRVVGAETVVSAMYRSVKENYEIYIKLKQPVDESRIKNTGAVIWEANLPTEVQGNEIISEGDSLIKVTIGRKINGINEDVNNILKNGLYDIIKDKKFNEYLGEYQNDGEEVASENKTTRRIITYVEKN